MANSSVSPSSLPMRGGHVAASNVSTELPGGVSYLLSLLFVGAAAVAAMVVDHTVSAPNLSLVFVLPVIVAALSFGWGPALAAALSSVAVFDFFFVEPRYTFQVANPSDVWALALLLLVAAIASTVAAKSREQALAARRSADQAEALQDLAHAVIRSEPADTVIETAAASLGRIFMAPAIILLEEEGALKAVAAARGASLSRADHEAAKWALTNAKSTRAETYPFDQAQFDFWPVEAATRPRLVLGVKLLGAVGGRPAAPERYVDLVAGYLAAAAKGAGQVRPSRATNLP